jgi:hypothetical protein
VCDSGSGEEGKPNRRFKPPTIEEVKLQAAKIMLPADQAEVFWNFYESKGWKVGKTQMKKWTCALTNWRIRWETERKNGSHRPNNSNSRPNPRNANVIIGPTDYGTAKPRLQREREEAEARAAAAKAESSRMAGQMDLPQAAPPATGAS